jgi:4-hydroxy-tetrahydrodipicolinate reductase
MRVCLAGATGGVGRCLAAAILDRDGLVLRSAVARRAAGQDIGTVLGRELSGICVTDDLEAALDLGADVLIDYTHPSVIFDHAMAAIQRAIPVVIGTSGLIGAQFDKIDEAARAAGIGVATGNFSVTAAMMQHFAMMAARHTEHWEVLEYNKPDKPDAPSGTAMELAQQLSGIRRPRAEAAIPETFGHPEARGADIDGTRVHAVRLPGFASACEAIFGLPGERLTIRHETLGDDAIFVHGTLLAARRVQETRGLIRGLNRLLFDE